MAPSATEAGDFEQLKEAKDGRASVRDVATSPSGQVGAYECAEITWHVYNIQSGVWGAGMHVDGM